MLRLLPLLGLAGALALTTVGCGDSSDDGSSESTASNGATSNNTASNGGKTDTPDGADTPENQCADRAQDVLGSAQKTFIDSAIRWSCADVAGVNTVGKDDRGQEYCEYHAIVVPPPEDGEQDGERPAAVELGRNTDGGRSTTPLKIDLNEDQIFWLEDNPDEVVGSCIFTSWHADINPLYPACEDEDCSGSNVHGIPVTHEHFRMKVGFNSNTAASSLVRDCLNGRAPVGDPDKLDDPLHNDFFRACMLTANLYGTHWRRSDPAVCAAAVRLKECGCSLPDNADIPTSLVPTQPQQDEEGNDIITLRGFPLGTWSGASELPLGCKYHETGDTSQTLVLCDITGSDLLVSSDDPKGKCREKYGDNVVVHVPIPPNVISCEPPENGFYADTCSDMPWVVEK